jgi:hypothetical protein
MKFRIAFASLCAVAATSSLMSMENGKARLNFILDNDICITGYSKHNMKFAAKPSDFLGNSILNVVPLSKEDREAVVFGLSEAVEKKKTVKVPYVLNDMNFIAKITALKTAEKKQFNYFVKIQEAKQ